MPSPFARYIKTKIALCSMSDMPFFHNVLSLHFWDIIQSGVLKTKHCSIFKEPLVYLFYGRPAYKTGSENGEKRRRDKLKVPISFILKPDCTRSVKRIYPFDTGGFEEHYREYIPKEYDYNRFFLGTAHETAKKLIELFFGSNGNYYSGSSCYKEEVKFHEMEVKAYLNVLEATGSTPFDDRAYTVEYQIPSDIDLSKNVIAVAAPSEAFNDKEITNVVVGKWGAVPLDYEISRFCDIRTVHGHMCERIRFFLKDKGYI